MYYICMFIYTCLYIKRGVIHLDNYFYMLICTYISMHEVQTMCTQMCVSDQITITVITDSMLLHARSKRGLQHLLGVTQRVCFVS